jgi:hypothetical protein
MAVSVIRELNRVACGFQVQIIVSRDEFGVVKFDLLAHLCGYWYCLVKKSNTLKKSGSH